MDGLIPPHIYPSVCIAVISVSHRVFLTILALGQIGPVPMEHAAPHHMHTTPCINGERKWFTMSYKHNDNVTLVWIWIRVVRSRWRFLNNHPPLPCCYPWV